MRTNLKEYDVVVIGGGTAGGNAGTSAIEQGATVAIVRKVDFWNTCVQRGCMPSKSMLASAKNSINPEEAIDRMDRQVEQLLGDHTASQAEKPYDIYKGTAFFTEEGHVKISGEDETVISGKRYVIAIGAEAVIPPIEGLDKLPEGCYFTVDVLLDKKKRQGRINPGEFPKSVLILGGGPVGIESAFILRGLGADTSIVEMREFLPTMDPEFGREFEKVAADKGIRLLPSSKISHVSFADGMVHSVCECSDGSKETLISEKLMIATGRNPNLEPLKLENIGIHPEKGKIKMREDDSLQSVENEDVYLAGDVAGNAILHYAAAEGSVAGKNAAKGSPKHHVRYDKLDMHILFSQPPIAQTGLTETEAEESGRETVSATVSFKDSGRGFVEGLKYGLWKVTCDLEGNIVGSQIIGERADDLIHHIRFAMNQNLTAQVLALTDYYHPTYTEYLGLIAGTLCEKLNQKGREVECPGC